MNAESSPADNDPLLARIDEQGPEALSAADVDAARVRAAADPEFRRELVSRLNLERALHTQFGETKVTGAAIVRKLKQRRRRTAVKWASLAALLAVAVVGTGLWMLPKPKPAEPPQVGEQTPAGESPQQDKTATDPARLREPLVAPRPEFSVAFPPIAQDPPIEPAPAVETVPPPWQETLSDEAPVLPFEQTAFASFGETVPGLPPNDSFPPSTLERWLSAAGVQPMKITAEQWRGMTFAGLEGIARLKAPWREDAVLRLGLISSDRCAIHLWNGERGVTLIYYSRQRPALWAGYGTTREGGSATPETWQLFSTDCGRFARANAGVVELRHREGHLILSRGDLVLLKVPFSEPPQELFLEGKFRLRELTMHRGDAPQYRVPLNSAALMDDQIERLEWRISDPAAALLEKQDRHVRLATTAEAGNGKLVWAAVSLPDEVANRTGLCDAVFQLGQASAGTGLYLGDQDGRPRHLLFFSKGTKAGNPTIRYVGSPQNDGQLPKGTRWESDTDPRNELCPGVGEGTWIRVVLGPGGLKLFVSSDGRHWGPAVREPDRRVEGAWKSIGCFAVTDGTPRAISLRGVQVRELTGISQLADAKLRKQVPELPDTLFRSGDWQEWIKSQRPQNVSERSWWRAVAVEAIARSLPHASTGKALAGLLRDEIAPASPLESEFALGEQLQTLHDAALLQDVWQGQAAQFTEYYDWLAEAAAEQEADAAELSDSLRRIGEGYLAAPLWTESRITSLPTNLARNTVAAAVWDQTGEAAAVARRFAAYLTPAHPDGGWSNDQEVATTRMLYWASRSHLEPYALGAVERVVWRHPLATEPGREGATLTAELQAALSAKAYDDAARLLSAASVLPGLLPALNDRDRYVPPSLLVSEAAADHPELVQTLEEQFGSAGLLRVREAVANDDAAALQAATVRFFGTAAAAEAHRRLGDLDLTNGRFAQAADHFSRALPTAPAAEKPVLQARIRLAAALVGDNAGKRLTQPVQLGGAVVEPTQFEDLVKRLRKARTLTTRTDEPTTVPEPQRLKPVERLAADGDTGRSPNRGDFRLFDWPGQQLSVAVAQRQIVVSNRYSVALYDLATHSQKWRVNLAGEMGEANVWSGIAFTPLLAGDKLFLRRLTNRGPELACLERSSGKLKWRTSTEVIAASDPFLWRDRLLATTLTGRGGGMLGLSLTEFAREDGQMLMTLPLLTFHDPGDGELPVSVTVQGNDFIVLAPGVIARFDGNGQPRWLRRLPEVPTLLKPSPVRPVHRAPLLKDGKVMIVLPGAFAIAALDPVSGRLEWSRPLGHLETLAGTAGSKLICRLEDGWMALDSAAGETAWMTRLPTPLTGMLVGTEYAVATMHTDWMNEKKSPAEVAIVWLETATGAVVNLAPLGLTNKELRSGPLFLAEEKLWLFSAPDPKEPKRTLYELQPDPSAPPLQTFSPQPTDHWSR